MHGAMAGHAFTMSWFAILKYNPLVWPPLSSPQPRASDGRNVNVRTHPGPSKQAPKIRSAISLVIYHHDVIPLRLSS